MRKDGGTDVSVPVPPSFLRRVLCGRKSDLRPDAVRRILHPAVPAEPPDDCLRQVKPQAAAVEKLYFTNNKTTGIGVAEARGVILLALAQHGVPLYEYTPMQVKQAVTGYGKAVKPQVQEMTRRLLGLQKVPQPDDTADALALAICHGQAAGSPLRKTLLQRGHKPEKVI